MMNTVLYICINASETQILQLQAQSAAVMYVYLTHCCDVQPTQPRARQELSLMHQMCLAWKNHLHEISLGQTCTQTHPNTYMHAHPHQMPAPVDGMVAEGPGNDELAPQQHHTREGFCSRVQLLEGHGTTNIPNDSTIQPWGEGGKEGRGEGCSF